MGIVGGVQVLNPIYVHFISQHIYDCDLLLEKILEQNENPLNSIALFFIGDIFF